ncbi:serine protease inhibitor Cvsi-2-like [Mya arenaria]|uniref:serine protease inhibitor Cvsi-2-like n=1 Tax=Mya arenaria TaxID=6604 RepID=UPI0022E4CE5B|nr:serine protease inhibitor Cvsi-2-like [Mya arenaria]
MRIVLSCAVVLACLALAYGEDCQGPADCSHVTCHNGGWTLDCNAGQCTCSSQSHACTTLADCAHVPDHGCHRELHCVDGRCSCRFDGPGGPGVPGGR